MVPNLVVIPATLKATRLADKPLADIEWVTLAASRMLRRYAACFIEGSASAKKPRLPLKSYVYRGYVFVLAVSLNIFRKTHLYTPYWPSGGHSTRN